MSSFIYNVDSLTTFVTNNPEDHDTGFDVLLVTKWAELHDTSGVFRYKLNLQHERILPGQYEFLLQLNEERATNRRKPEMISCLTQEFDPQKFHFNKIPTKEHLFQITNTDSKGSTKDILIVNQSPICFAHSLICPSIEECLPQILTLRSLYLTTDIMFLSHNRNLRIGFNSLCAMASVNHLHYHLFILDHRLPIEHIECEHVWGPLYVIDKHYPAKGFCFQIKSMHEIQSMCSHIYKLITYLMEKNVAHNLYMTKGNALDDSSCLVLRVFVWARINCYIAKDISSFNLAICELSGHFPIKTCDDYETLTEIEIANILEENTRPIFNEIRKDVEKLFV